MRSLTLSHLALFISLLHNQTQGTTIPITIGSIQSPISPPSPIAERGDSYMTTSRHSNSTPMEPHPADPSSLRPLSAPGLVITVPLDHWEGFIATLPPGTQFLRLFSSTKPHYGNTFRFSVRFQGMGEGTLDVRHLKVSVWFHDYVDNSLGQLLDKQFQASVTPDGDGFEFTLVKPRLVAPLSQWPHLTVITLGCDISGPSRIKYTADLYWKQPVP